MLQTHHSISLLEWYKVVLQQNHDFVMWHTILCLFVATWLHWKSSLGSVSVGINWKRKNRFDCEWVGWKSLQYSGLCSAHLKEMCFETDIISWVNWKRSKGMLVMVTFEALLLTSADPSGWSNGASWENVMSTTLRTLLTILTLTIWKIAGSDIT